VERGAGTVKGRAMKRQPKTAPDGTKHGDAIPGSAFYRTFCARCDEPMRVTEAKLSSVMFCGDCDPKHMGVGSPGGWLDDTDAYGRSSP
jgi:hypothetical protein